jgi:hypothetical protein
MRLHLDAGVWRVKRKGRWGHKQPRRTVYMVADDFERSHALGVYRAATRDAADRIGQLAQRGLRDEHNGASDGASGL